MYLPVPEFTPTSNRVLVRKIEIDKKNGVLLPPSQKMMFERGIVVSTGPGERVEGKLVPLAVKKGDQVLYSGGSAADIKMENGETLWLMTESAILGIVNEGQGPLAGFQPVSRPIPAFVPDTPENDPAPATFVVDTNE